MNTGEKSLEVFLGLYYRYMSWQLLRVQIQRWYSPRTFLSSAQVTLWLPMRLPGLLFQECAVCATAWGTGLSSKLSCENVDWNRSRPPLSLNDLLFDVVDKQVAY